MLARVLRRRHTAAPAPAPITRAVVLCSVIGCTDAPIASPHGWHLCASHTLPARTRVTYAPAGTINEYV